MMAYFKQSRNTSLTKQRTFLHCKYICKNSAINEPWLLISGSSVQGDWNLPGLVCGWLQSILTNHSFGSFLQLVAWKLSLRSQSALNGMSTANLFFRGQLSPALIAQNWWVHWWYLFCSLSASPPSSSCPPVASGLHMPLLWGSFFSLGWVCLWPSSPSIFWPKNTSNINQNNLHAYFALKHYFHAEPYIFT